MLRKLWPLALVLVCCLTFLFPASALAKAMRPMNLYGGISVQVSSTCPTATDVVNLPFDSKIQSITVSGQTNGSLKLYDTAGQINETVSSSSYSFTTTKSDLLQACLTTGSTGSLSYSGQINLYSANYAGYGVTGLAAQSNTYTSMTGSWTIPTANCDKLNREKSSASIWIGFGALPYTGSQSLEQIGTEVQCNYLGRAYQAVDEMVPSDSGHVVITSACSDSNQTSCSSVNATVQSGDAISAKISYIGNGNFLMQEYDATQHWYVNVTRSQPGSDQPSARYSAEWIQEKPDAVLTDFGQVDFTDCYADGAAIRNAGPAVEQFTIKPDGSNTIKAQPLGLTGSGSNFSVLFENH
jgi:hypothetical protein